MELSKQRFRNSSSRLSSKLHPSVNYSKYLKFVSECSNDVPFDCSLLTGELLDHPTIEGMLEALNSNQQLKRLTKLNLHYITPMDKRPDLVTMLVSYL